MCKNLKELKKKFSNWVKKINPHSALIGVAAGVILATSAMIAYKMNYAPSSSGSCKVPSGVYTLFKLQGIEDVKLVNEKLENGICILYFKGQKGNETIEVKLPVVGNYLIQSAIDLNTLPSNPIELMVNRNKIKTIQPEVLRFNTTKTPPKVQLFIMSNCPYGDIAEKYWANAILNGSKVPFTLEPVYILSTSPMYKGQEGYKIGNTTFYSLHGPAEVLQDAYEICVYHLYGEKAWAKFVLALDKLSEENKLGNTIEERLKAIEETAEQLGFNWTELQKCVNETAEQLLKQGIELQNKMGIAASPTVVINGVPLQGVQTNQTYEEMLCKSYANCNQNQ